LGITTAKADWLLKHSRHDEGYSVAAPSS